MPADGPPTGRSLGGLHLSYLCGDRAGPSHPDDTLLIWVPSCFGLPRLRGPGPRRTAGGPLLRSAAGPTATVRRAESLRPWSLGSQQLDRRACGRRR
jgi:hypothetical protein